MKTLKRFVASSLLSMGLLAGAASSAFADILIYECTLVSTTIDYEAGTITDTYRCRLAAIIFE